MSQYTTGEMAKQCSVTVRTVQYYDKRGILTPSALSEGGRRLYSEDDLRRLRIICFLRELGLPIDAIGQLLAEEDPGSVIGLLLAQQEETLRAETRERQEKLERLEEVRRSMRSLDRFSVESIGDIAYFMTNRQKLKKVHLTLFFSALPISLLEIGGILLGALTGRWWLLIIWAVLFIPAGILISRYYYRSVAYICPRCHEVFRPSFREMFFAAHTPRTRKLTCVKCGHHGYCVETAAEEA